MEIRPISIEHTMFWSTVETPCLLDSNLDRNPLPNVLSVWIIPILFHSKAMEELKELFDLFEDAYNAGSFYEYDNEYSWCESRGSKTFDQWLEENKQTIVKIIQQTQLKNDRLD